MHNNYTVYIIILPIILEYPIKRHIINFEFEIFFLKNHNDRGLNCSQQNSLLSILI